MNRYAKILLVSILSIGTFAGCKNATGPDNPATDPVINPPVVVIPVVSVVTPVDLATSVHLKSTLTARFNTDMDAATITADTFVVKHGDERIAGTVTYKDRMATFAPVENFLVNTVYTATVTTGSKDTVSSAMATAKVWSFVTRLGPEDVNLGTAGNFVILSEAGIDSIPTSYITGDIGVSPVSSTYLTHFSLILDSTGVFSKSDQVTGKVYASDYGLETPANLTTAVSDMMLADTDISGRINPDMLNLGTGNLGDMTLVPGLYTWDTGVSIVSDITLSGGANDVWIFQVPGVLYMGFGVKVLLTGGAQAKNIYWKVNSATFNAGAHFEGNLLSNTSLAFVTGASANGRLFAHTTVALDACMITEPKK